MQIFLEKLTSIVRSYLERLKEDIKQHRWEETKLFRRLTGFISVWYVSGKHRIAPSVEKAPCKTRN